MEQRRAGTSRHFSILALILILGAGLRIVGLGRESLWADEALTLVLANWPTGDMLMQPTDPTPFLYYFLHKLLVPPGAGAAAARSISLAAGIFSIGAMYLVGRLAFGRRGGLLAAALLAVWGAHIDYSQEARAYSLLFLLTLGSAAGLLWWFHESGKDEATRIGPVPARRVALALFATATVLSFYTHLVSIFWIALAVQILVSVTLRTRPKRCFAEAGVALAAMALLAIPGLVRLAREMSTPDAFHWLPQQGPAGFLSTTADLLLPAGLGPIPGSKRSARAASQRRRSASAWWRGWSCSSSARFAPGRDSGRAIRRRSPSPLLSWRCRRCSGCSAMSPGRCSCRARSSSPYRA